MPTPLYSWQYTPADDLNDATYDVYRNGISVGYIQHNRDGYFPGVDIETENGPVFLHVARHVTLLGAITGLARFRHDITAAMLAQ